MIGSGVEHMGHIPFGVGFSCRPTTARSFSPQLMENATT